VNPNSHTSDVTSEEHNTLARKISAASQVLLKNEDNLLPLSKDTSKKIALIGKSARSPITYG
jgi:beta-glucosidase